MLTRFGAETKRIFERLEALYTIGEGEGANRPGYGPEEQAAVDLAAGWMLDAGLELEVDAAGNLIGRAAGSRPDLPEVWTGSHLDTVPRGGRFDGALGVVAGIEAVGIVAATRPERTLGLVVFRAEETGCHGSRARAGGGNLPGAYVELHVEQGPVLADRAAPLGIVTSIAGIVRAERVFGGRAGHAGTTPMGLREDALVAAARFVLQARDAATVVPGAVATIGELEVRDAAVNVIPDHVRVTVDARAADPAALDALAETLGLEPYYRVAPSAMAERPREALRAELERLGLPVVELPSGAGHDAGILAAVGVESGMLFVRSLAGGVSHCPEEESSAEDVELAVSVLAGALARLAA